MRSIGCTVNVGAAAVPAAHHQRALVVAVDQADQVAQHDAVFVAQARARQDHRGQAGVADVDGDAGRDQHRLAGLQQQRRVEAGAQVEAGAAGRGVGRQLLGHARVEHLQVDRRSSCAVMRWAISRTRSRARLSLSPLRQFALAGGVDQQQRVVVAAEGGRAEVADDQRHALALQLLARVARQVLALGGEAHAPGPLRRRQRAPPRPGCRGSRSSSKLGASFLPSFLILCSSSCAGRQSATAAVATKMSCAGAAGSTASNICCALVTSMRRTPRGVGRCTGPATSVTCGAGLGGGARDREAHLAAAQVGDAAHRVDGLEGRAGGDQHAAAGQQLGLEEGDQLVAQFVGFEHAAVADLAAGLVAAARAQHAWRRRPAPAPRCAAWPGAPTSRGSSPAPAAAGSARSAAPGTAGSAGRRRGPAPAGR